MAAPRRRIVAWFVIGVSLVIAGMGASSVTRMLRAEREARATTPIPPRGASTTIAGLTIGLGIAGVLTGCGLLLSERRRPER